MGFQLTKTEKFDLVNQFLALCLITTFLGLLLSGCGQPGSLKGQTVKKNAQTSRIPEVTQPSNEPEKTIRDVQLNITVGESNLSDVIIVIDNSASMRFEQANMAQRFSSLLDEMSSLDWRLGIITTDVSQDQPKKDGRFLDFVGMPRKHFLSSGMDPDLVKVSFAATIQRPSREGNANEQGIKATFRALERKPEWLRRNASLNVVVVTDADETPYKGKAEVRNNPSDLLKYVKSEYPTKPFFFHSIIVKEGDENCLKKDDNEGYGRSYTWLSIKTGGIVGDVCEQDYSKQLKMIGEKVSQQIKSVELECTPLPGSVIVKTENGQVITDFSLDRLTLNFPQPLPVGNTKISFQCYGLNKK